MDSSRDHPNKRWSLRPTLGTEFEWAFALQNRAMGQYIAQSWNWDESRHREIFTTQIFDQHLRVIEVDGQRAGLLRVVEEEAEVRLEILELDPDWQGLGVGGEILDQLLTSAAQRAKRLTLSVLPPNTRALRFYERHGLEVVGREEHRILMASAPKGRT